MKWIYTISVLIALSACSSQKYSNTKYQENNNDDDAYFSPNDVAESAKTERGKTKADEGIEKYKANSPSYYDNTLNETANPNAANRNTNYNQYTPAPTGGNTTANSNALMGNNSSAQQWQNRNTLNMYNQPQWGVGFSYSPFAPWSAPGVGITYSNWGRNNWYIGPTNTFGAGWNYNPWYGWTYSPYTWNSWNNGWGCPPIFNSWNSWNYSTYSPWYNPWNDPWGWNNPYSWYGYNPYWGFNPYYGYGYNPYNNYWGGWNNNDNNNNTVHQRRRPGNTFMPATRGGNVANTSPNNGTRIIGSTERQAPATRSTDPTPTNYTPGSSSGTTPTGANTTPTRSQPNYYNYTPTPASTAGSSAPSHNNTQTTPQNPGNGRSNGGAANYNPNAGSAGTQQSGGNSNSSAPSNNRNSNYQQPQQNNYTPPAMPTQRSVPAGNGGGRSIAPGSGGGGNSGGGRRR